MAQSFVTWDRNSSLVCSTGLSRAVVVVGRVVAFRNHLRWFDERPLFGKRVLVTRPRDQAAEMVDRLSIMGAEAIEAPMIRVEAPDDYGPLDKAAAEAGTYDWIVFTSTNAVDFFMRRLLAVLAVRPQGLLGR